MKWKIFAAVVGLLLLGLILVGCGATPEPCPECPECPEAECPEVECPEAECPECPEVECPECPVCPEPEAGEAAMVTCPMEEQWAESAHANAEAEAFRHWDEDDPMEVSASCATCHSTTGYQNAVAGLEVPAVPVGEVIECVACHNEAAMALETVTFPSGVTLTIEGPQARCAVCHQGRASTVQVNSAIEGAGLTDEDTVSADLRFTNIHYKAAAASRYGTWVQGGYEYEGKMYDAVFDHVEGEDACVQCHSPHTLELQAEACAECHTESDPKDIRMAGSERDYDGDGDMEEGIYYEVEGLQAMLLGAIEAYAGEVAGAAITYDAASYPYFLTDAGEGYASWTPRLLKAAYNYQTSLKDPGSYAHGGKYMIQLLYDSIESLNEKIGTPVDLSAASRIDAGHFAGSEEAWRHWDEDAEVSGSCVKCHQADGLPQFLANGVNIAMPQSGSMNCATCHDDLVTFTRYTVDEVEFPSGAVVSFGEGVDANLCLLCHQGRESTVSVNAAINRAGVEDDVVSEGLSFRNVHYFAAGATLFGGEAQGAYQYEGKEYVGRNAHVEPYSNCAQCHSAHGLEVKAEDCSVCHAGVEDLADIRMDSTDYDGDGDTAEGMAGEVASMVDGLYAAMQAYVEATDGVSPIVYDAHAYPYFFDDAGERYATWTPALLRAAYNYQYAQKDPGAYAHNAKYALQFLYDGIEALGGDVSGMTRP
jgi:hypothetical protein